MKTYPPEVKAQVLIDFALGMSKAAIARKHSLPRTTVIDWITTQESPIPTVTDIEKKDDLGALVYEYLATGLNALIAQAREAARPEYIRAQPADALYLLHGTIADKLIAIFGAIERGQPEDSATQDEPAQLSA